MKGKGKRKGKKKQKGKIEVRTKATLRKKDPRTGKVIEVKQNVRTLTGEKARGLLRKKGVNLPDAADK